MMLQIVVVAVRVPPTFLLFLYKLMYFRRVIWKDGILGNIVPCNNAHKEQSAIPGFPTSANCSKLIMYEQHSDACLMMMMMMLML